VKISIFGLGYVGAVSAGCLAHDGHEVIGVDLNEQKVDLINRGRSPIIEHQLDRLIEAAVKAGRLRATTDVQEAVASSQLFLICVGTPSLPSGNLDLCYISRVCEELGSALKEASTFHTVVVRSTMLPGSMQNTVIPRLEASSGKVAGVNFGVCFNPEFLREGSAVHDFYHPPKTVIGESDKRSGDLLASLYRKIDAPIIRTDIETAEMVKYTDNAWHALKVGFANEIGNICKALNIDAHDVMGVFCQDTKLNLSPYYLKPGFAFGGSCLPKDLRALTYKGRNLDLELPILNAILPSNQYQIERGLRMIMAAGNKRVGILGLSFKAGTDDLRESPMVEITERLLGKGYHLCLYDYNVKLASLVGANRDYILKHIPHISNLLVDSLDEVLEHADTLVIGNDDIKFRDVLKSLRSRQVVVDLVRITNNRSEVGRYEGICW
jgi:GDP-mannose 6-dehydrogenase